MSETVRIDIHTHSGGVLYPEEPLEDIAGTMRQGGMHAACFAVVPDAPLLSITEKGQIRVDASVGINDILDYTDRAFAKLSSLIERQGFLRIRTTNDLWNAAMSGVPGAICAIEGADHLQGDLAQLDRDFRDRDVRQLGLVHYRVNEIGDIQTEPELHGGLTAFGRDVVRRCNEIGIIVDLAHASVKTAQQVIDCARAPLVCSHTSLASSGDANPRLLEHETAKRIASTGGLIGVWPNKDIFPTTEHYFSGIARVADLVGVDCVAIGTDTGGVRNSVFCRYEDTSTIVDGLVGFRFSREEAAKIAGLNYVRVLDMVTWHAAS